MAMVPNLTMKYLGHTSQVLVNPTASLTVFYRFASKKTGTTTQNAGNSRPKHRGWKKQHGSTVTAGSILATQRTLRFHPGLNVGFGKNGSLFAIYPGKVIVTSEKTNLNWDHTWVKRNFEDRQDQVIYKKHFNVIPESEHNRFKLIDKI